VSEVPPAEEGVPTETGIGLLGRLSLWLAIAGGALSVATALLVVVSVSLRRAGLGTVPGDFELVQMCTALTVFAFLPWCQARRGNVFVDTFTTRLPKTMQAGLDALWDLVYAGMMALIAWRLWLGAMDAIQSGTTTMVLRFSVGPAIAACAVMSAFLALVAVATALARVRSVR
jgi:TRAP-type C4-dicarboxylate transport system permease small subunit